MCYGFWILDSGFWILGLLLFRWMGFIVSSRTMVAAVLQ